MTICPNPDQWDNVSKTVSPVTQVALVAVNKQERKSVVFPVAEAAGNIRRSAPIRMITRKPPKIIFVGLILR